MKMEYYDELSKGYDELYGAEQLAKMDFILPWLRFLEGFTLDLGAGTGLIQKYLIPEVSADISFGMLKKNSGPSRVCADAQFLPFKNDSFQNLISITMLQDIHDKRRVLEEIARVTKGNVVLTILKRNHEKSDVDELLSKYFEILDSVIEEKDYCYFMKRKEIKKQGKLRIKI